MRQYVDWRPFRHLDVRTTAVREAIERFCDKIVNALREPWVSPEERGKQLEIEAQERSEEQRCQLQADATRREEEEARQKKDEDGAQRVAAERRRRAGEARRRRADKKTLGIQAGDARQQTGAAWRAEEQKQRVEATRLAEEEQQRAGLSQPLPGKRSLKSSTWMPIRVSVISWFRWAFPPAVEVVQNKGWTAVALLFVALVFLVHGDDSHIVPSWWWAGTVLCVAGVLVMFVYLGDVLIG